MKHHINYFIATFICYFPHSYSWESRDLLQQRLIYHFLPGALFKKVESKNIRKSFFWPLYRWDLIREMEKRNITKSKSWWEKEQKEQSLKCYDVVTVRCYVISCPIPCHPLLLPSLKKITLLHIAICYLVTWMRTSFLNSRSYFSPYLVVQ